MPFVHWSTIVLTKVAGLTFRSSSPVDASLIVGATDDDDASSGSAVQLAERCIILLGSLGLLMMMGDGNFVVLQNEMRCLLFDVGSEVDDLL